MSQGLLSHKDTVRIRLAPSMDIASADDEVFLPEHQEEARLLIFESDFLRDAMQDVAGTLRAGRSQFVSVTETGRQTAFRYEEDGGRMIVLTRAHHGITKVLETIQ